MPKNVPQKGKKMKRQRDEETKRQKDKKIKIQKDRQKGNEKDSEGFQRRIPINKYELKRTIKH